MFILEALFQILGDLLENEIDLWESSSFHVIDSISI